MTNPTKLYECEGCDRKAPCVKTVESSSGETSQCCECRSFDGERCEECARPCQKCKKVTPVEDLDIVSKQTCGASMGGPAEYDEQEWCDSCRERERHYAENEGYYRALASGWND